MPSEKLASAENLLKGNLASAWNILEGSSGDYTDLGIARRFGGAAAAYSLRDIGAMNGRVVNVRREPHDKDGVGGASNPNDETDFSANQVQSGALEDWVNGKLESTLPVDVDPTNAAAAYSLRKVKADYSGDAVRIRRSSDDIEVDVAFDSEGKVSASSPITDGGTELTPDPDADLGSTTATTLGDFLGQTSITTGVAEMASGSSSALSNATTTGFTLTQTGGLIGAMFPFSSNVGVGSKVTMTFTLSEDSGDATCSFRLFSTVGLGNAGSPSSIAKNDSGTFTIEFEATAEARGIGFFDNVSGSVVTISNASITIENSAFVHTWYDQAGSNDAVQETAANQPKIAEDGALLADGLTFDGSNDFLQTSTQVLTGTETGANSMYAVIKQTSGDAGYICGSAASPIGGDQIGQSLYSASSDKIVLTNGNDATSTGTLDIITRIEGSNYLVSSNYSNNNTDTLHSNANANGYANGSSAYDFNAGDRFTIGARKDSTSAAAVLFDGSMKEIIAYDSDQTDNRFKIESNINNYYGLYNDANETSATAFSFDGERSGGTTSANGLNGFTLDVQTAAAYAGFQLSQKVANTDKIYVSFNAVLTGGSGGASSPQFKLRSGSISGTGTSDTYDVVSGFNGFNVTSNDDDSEYISFSEGDDNRIFTISDFKVSRIARDGFVETWYDQSGNGNDATQGTAGNQPAIVQNGGLISDGIQFDGDADALNFTDLTLTDASIFTVLDINGTENLQIILGGSTSTPTATMIPMMQTSSSTTQVYKNATVGGAEQGNSQFRNGSQITLNNRGDAFTELAAQDKMLFTMIDVDVAADKVLDGISQTPSDATTWGLKGTMEELIIYNTNLSSDRGTIESEIANYYNITLS